MPEKYFEDPKELFANFYKRVTPDMLQHDYEVVLGGQSFSVTFIGKTSEGGLGLSLISPRSYLHREFFIDARGEVETEHEDPVLASPDPELSALQHADPALEGLADEDILREMIRGIDNGPVLDLTPHEPQA